MTFKFYCTNCGQKLEAEDEHIGHEIPCPVCNHTILITEPRLQQFIEPKAEQVESNNTKSNLEKIDQLRKNVNATFEGISSSEIASDLSKNLQDLSNKGKKAALSAADTLTKSGKIAGLQAKIKKLETIDLRKALQELGEKCFSENTIYHHQPELYAELGTIRKEIEECNDKGLQELATLGGKEQVKRLALKAQLKIKEEQLKGQYREKLIALGEKGLNSEEARESCKDLIKYIISLNLQVKQCKESIDSLGMGIHLILRKPWRIITTLVLVVGMLWGFYYFLQSDNRALGDDYIAARNGDADAQLQVAHAYFNGSRVKQDYLSAKFWYQESARQGNKYAKKCLEDINSFSSLLSKAQEGDVYAEKQLAEAYFSGSGILTDKNAGFRWMLKAAEGGNPEAQCEIGWEYHSGRNVPQDNTKSIDWFKKAAKNGNTDAQIELGKLYIEGTIVPQNINEALKLLKQAGGERNADARYWINRIGLYETNKDSVPTIVSNTTSESIDPSPGAQFTGLSDADKEALSAFPKFKELIPWIESQYRGSGLSNEQVSDQVMSAYCYATSIVSSSDSVNYFKSLIRERLKTPTP